MGLKMSSILMVFFSFFIGFSQESFKVVLDAGHGGSDPGKVAHGLKEKNIALAITLEVGKILSKQKNLELVYTRKTDVFIGLKERSEKANKEEADLFVSIHCNSAGKNFTPYGTETFVMGTSRVGLNLEIAKRENSVILMENDYKNKYNGFDPNKPETLIGLKILQEEYLNQSIDLAAKIEKQFSSKFKRKSRGVKQSPLWVLDATYMPSVLIETGFLTNVKEGRYLNSSKGRKEIATAIATAIIEYKSENFETEPIVVTEQENEKSDIVFKVQIAAGKRSLATKPYNFKGLETISKEKAGAIYKYFYAKETSYNKIKTRLQQAKAKGYATAFIVAYKKGKKISVSKALQ